MKKKNGFITYYFLWIGTMLLAMALASSTLVFSYYRSARQYYESVQLGYVAESALLLGWDDIRQRAQEDVPTKKTWKLDDIYDVTGEGQHMEIQCISTSYQLPFTGTVRGIAIDDSSAMKRTCALRFRAAPQEKELLFSKTQLIY